MKHPWYTRILLALAFALIMAVSVHMVRKHQGKRISDLRAEWPQHLHSMIPLPSGNTHYQEINPDSRREIVLIHGVSGPMVAWDHSVDFLANQNFRILRYDLFGRGFSERVPGPYNLDLFIQQLEELLEAKNIYRPVLIGSSFGCVIAAEFAKRYPHRAKGLILIGPAGFKITVPPLAEARDIPILGNLLFGIVGKSLILEQNRKYFVDEKVRSKYMPFYKDQLSVQGSAKAILSTMRHSPVQSYESSYRQLSRLLVPLKLIWGREDITFPFSNHKKIMESNPGAEFYPVDNSAHLPMYERPKEINLKIYNFLESIFTQPPPQ